MPLTAATGSPGVQLRRALNRRIAGRTRSTDLRSSPGPDSSRGGVSESLVLWPELDDPAGEWFDLPATFKSRTQRVTLLRAFLVRVARRLLSDA